MSSFREYGPAYQVDFFKKSCGKKISKTKRYFIWKYGFANEEAIAKGLVGSNCRGEEHEISLKWSINSGKVAVKHNENDIYYAVNPRQSVFHYRWTMSNGHSVKIIAYAVPKIKAPAGWLQFDLILSGNSFFSLPKIFELGSLRMKHDEIKAIVSSNSSHTNRNESSEKKLIIEKDICVENIPTLYEAKIQTAKKKDEILQTSYGSREPYSYFNLLDSNIESSPASSLLLTPFDDAFNVSKKKHQLNILSSIKPEDNLSSQKHYWSEMKSAHEKNLKPPLVATKCLKSMDVMLGNTVYARSQNQIMDSVIGSSLTLASTSMTESSVSSASAEEDLWGNSFLVGSLGEALKSLVNINDLSSSPSLTSKNSAKIISSYHPERKSTCNQDFSSSLNSWNSIDQPYLGELKAARSTSTISKKPIMPPSPHSMHNNETKVTLEASQLQQDDNSFLQF